MPPTSITQYHASTTRSAGASVPSTNSLSREASSKALGMAARRGTTRSMRTLTVGDLRLIRPRGAALAVRLPRATPTGAWGGPIRCRSSLPLKSAPHYPASLGERRRQQRSPRSASSMATSGRARSTPASNHPAVDSLPPRPPSASSPDVEIRDSRCSLRPGHGFLSGPGGAGEQRRHRAGAL
jgi:hypothetical protein